MSQITSTEIKFDDFIQSFYSNWNKTPIVLQIDIEGATSDSNTSIYDIHQMLIDLFVNGIDIYNLQMESNWQNAIALLQFFYNNINIKINVQNFTRVELEYNLSYYNRYMKFMNTSNILINSGHLNVECLEKINSFYLISDSVNLCISFEHKLLNNIDDSLMEN